MSRPDPTDFSPESTLDDGSALAAAPSPERVVPTTPVPAEGLEDDRRADAAERDLTRALAALRRKGQRAVERVESVLEPRHVAIGAGVVAGLAAVWMLTRTRRPRRYRAPSIGGTIARSIVREALGRLVLGAATTAGARLAEAAVPMLVASLSAQQTLSPASKRPSRRRAATAAAALDEIE